MSKMKEQKIGYTENVRFTCLEGLQMTSEFRNVRTLSLDYCGWEKCDPGFRFGPYVRQCYVIHFVLSGKGTYSTPDGVFSLQKGQAFVIRPGEETWYQADEQDPWVYCWLGFHGLQAEKAVDKIGFNHRYVIDLSCQETVRAGIEEIVRWPQITFLNEMRRASVFYRILAVLVEEHEKSLVVTHKKNTEKDYPSDVYVRATLDFIHNHYNERIKIDEIADYIGITRGHLTNSFKKRTGMSPQQFLINFRLENAAHMLVVQKERTIAEVAEDCGYDDGMSFSKAFKQKYGMSPKEFRDSDLKVEQSFCKMVDNWDYML